MYCEVGDLEYDSDITSKYWELESVDTHQVFDVQGRLKHNLAFWKETLHAFPPVLDCIEYRYLLPLKFLPPHHEHSNHRSAKEHYEVVNDAVNRLVTNWCAMKVCKQVDIPISKNQALQILYLKHHDNVCNTS